MWKSATVWASAAVLATWGQVALGGPVNFKDVPANAKWVAHFDGKAARSSEVMKAFVKECMSKDVQTRAHDSSHTRPWAAISLDKIDGATLYGSRVGVRNGAAIVRGKYDKKALLASIKAKADVKTATAHGHEVYTWTKCKGTKQEHEVALAFPKEGVLVFAAGPKQLHAAVDLLEGKGESLEGKKSPLTEDVPKGAVLFARADGLKADDVGPKFAVFRLIEGFNYFARENEGRWEESLNINANTDRAAATLQMAFQGMLALAELAFIDQPNVVKMLEAGKISHEGKKVHIHYEGDAASLAKVIPDMCEGLRGHWAFRMSVYNGYTDDRLPSSKADRDQTKKKTKTDVRR